MKKLIMTFLLAVFTTSGYCQTWETKELIKHPISKTIITESIYHYQDSRTTAEIHLSPVFNDLILIDTSNPFGRFHYNIFRHGITTKATIKIYNEDDKKIYRTSETIGLGTFNTNRGRTFGTLKNKKVYDYLMNEKGYVVIFYRSLFNNQDVEIVITCKNN